MEQNKDRQTAPGRLPEIDLLKGILTALVVIGHFLYPFRRSHVLTRAVFFGIYSFHMPAFVFVSGLLSGGICRRDASGKCCFRGDKLLRLLLYYLLYKLLNYPLACLLYGREPLRLLSESGAPWYLLSLAEWYLFLPFFSGLCRHFPGKCGRFLVLGLSLLIGLWSGYLPYAEYFLCWQRTAAFLPFFAAGWLLGPEGFFSGMAALRTGLRGMGGLLAGLFGLLLAVLGSRLLPDAVMHVFYGMHYGVFESALPAELYRPLYGWLRLGWYLLAAAEVLGLCALAARCSRQTEARGNVVGQKQTDSAVGTGFSAMLSFLGRHSLAIYILHRPVRDLWMYFFLR